ncbi:hypothetical protein [Pseudomonas sp. CFBP 13719]|uniref:hypothetical protein n=1 Tax=Pseudomonas sp. CFBP 13719 TaxID=2775303 RepID=UPI000F03DF6A|nr:hypothetical protein [Pseudomonas sp. CFBP 13719]MBD8681894.1 hypothetical protein [Pseudomonas sp. CFBP 13719]
MRAFDLYRESCNPAPEQLQAVCAAFSKAVANKPRHTDWTDLLIEAKHLAEQILGHYYSLETVSQELCGLRREGSKLTREALSVFVYASVYEHGTLHVLLREIEALYGDGKDHSFSAFTKGIWNDSMLSGTVIPRLWGHNGKLNCSPAGYASIHKQSFQRQVNDFYNKGPAGVQKILDDYPVMSEASRQLLDKTLCEKVYQSIKPADDPVRALLGDKLNDIEDGYTRFAEMFEVLDDPDVYANFDLRLEHAFALMRALPIGQATDIVHKAISTCIREWMADHGDGANRFNHPEMAVPGLIKVLEKADEFGFCALDEVCQNVHYRALKTLNKSMVQALLDEGFVEDPYEMDTADAWKQAALTAASEDVYLSLGLDERYLVKLLKLKGTPKLREALKKTETGREVVFGQDLGL